MESLYVSEITVLGIGNTILTDEGFGVRVVEYLQKNYDFPEMSHSLTAELWELNFNILMSAQKNF